MCQTSFRPGLSIRYYKRSPPIISNQSERKLPALESERETYLHDYGGMARFGGSPVVACRGLTALMEVEVMVNTGVGSGMV